MSFESPLRTLRESQVVRALLTPMTVHAAVVRSADEFILHGDGRSVPHADHRVCGPWLILAMYMIGPGTHLSLSLSFFT
jgi:hypothetical protein